MAAALPLLVSTEKGAEDDEALNVTEIFYNRVADHIRNQPDGDAARSHAFDKQRMDELIQALDGWDDLDAQERSRRNKEIGNNQQQGLQDVEEVLRPGHRRRARPRRPQTYQ